jgi:hypothetical protein
VRGRATRSVCPRRSAPRAVKRSATQPTMKNGADVGRSRRRAATGGQLDSRWERRPPVERSRSGAARGTSSDRPWRVVDRPIRPEAAAGDGSAITEARCFCPAPDARRSYRPSATFSSTCSSPIARRGTLDLQHQFQHVVEIEPGRRRATR